MNTNEEKSKNSLIKALAIVGLIAIVIVAIWAVVQIVRVLPSAFSSLASVADTIYSNRPVSTLTVTTEKDIVNTGASFKVSWTDLNRSGDYSFYYTCTDGVSIDIRTTDGNTQPVLCETSTAIPEGETSFVMTVNSEQRRFVDVPFTIAFTEPNKTEPLFERNSKITVVNASIPQSVDVARENGSTTTAATSTTGGSTTQQPSGSGSTAGTPQTVHKTISYYPQSYANGFTDLKVSYLGLGTLSGSTFTPAGSLPTGKRGAIKFEVKNIGTKTSDSWTFDATLPTGYVYHSSSQTGLKPNEQAVYTLGFDTTGTTGTKPIKVVLHVPNDTQTSNDSFNWNVKVTN